MPVQWSSFTLTHIQLELPLRWCVKLWRPFLPERDSTLTSVAATPALSLLMNCSSSQFQLYEISVHSCFMCLCISASRTTMAAGSGRHRWNFTFYTKRTARSPLLWKWLRHCTRQTSSVHVLYIQRHREAEQNRAEHKLTKLFLLLSSSLTITNPKFYSDDRNSCFSQLMAQEWNNLRFLFCSFSMEFRIRSVIKAKQSRDGWRSLMEQAQKWPPVGLLCFPCSSSQKRLTLR